MHRDSKSHFATPLGDGDRKPVACLHLNGKKHKYPGVFDAEDVETRYPIDSLDEICAHADAVRGPMQTYRD